MVIVPVSMLVFLASAVTLASSLTPAFRMQNVKLKMSFQQELWSAHADLDTQEREMNNVTKLVRPDIYCG